MQVKICMQCQAFSWLTCCECAGGAYKDAVGVCAHELGDPQLALFLARLLEGGQSPLQQHLLSRELLPGHTNGTAIPYAASKGITAALQITLCRVLSASTVKLRLAWCIQQQTTSMHGCNAHESHFQSKRPGLIPVQDSPHRFCLLKH